MKSIVGHCAKAFPSYAMLDAIKNKSLKMNTIHQSMQPITTIAHFFRVGERLFDKDWNEIKTYQHKGWNYVKINGKQIGVSSFESKEGYSEPIYFNYVFGGGFMNGDNFYYDQLLKL